MKSSHWYLYILLIVTGAAVLIFGIASIRTVYSAISSENWRESHATVIERIDLPKSAKIRYSYTVNEKQYIGSNFSFLSEGSIQDKGLIQSSYRVGDSISIYVNPNDASEAIVLKRPIKFANIWPHLMIVPMLTFFFFLFARQLRALKLHQDNA